MIFVKRITGESFDFQTGTEIPKMLVLSNGIDEVSVPVDNDDALKVVRLMMASETSRETHEAAIGPLAGPRATPPASPAPRANNDYADPDTGAASI